MAILHAGCAFRGQGVVMPTPSGARFEAIDGQDYELRARGDNRPVLYLDGHLTEIRGVRVADRIRVDDWRVIEGKQGFSVWVGQIVVAGGETALYDRQLGGWFRLDAKSLPTLRRFVTRPILIEGFLESEDRIRVVSYRVLDEAGTSGD